MAGGRGQDLPHDPPRPLPRPLVGLLDDLHLQPRPDVLAQLARHAFPPRLTIASCDPQTWKSRSSRRPSLETPSAGASPHVSPSASSSPTSACSSSPVRSPSSYPSGDFSSASTRRSGMPPSS